MTLFSLTDFRLDGSTAVVTGGSRNIGRSIALAYAAAGADLVLVARHAGPLAQVAGLAREAGAAVREVVADVSTAEGVAALAKATDELDVDILVNNAHTIGGTPGRSLLETDDDVWHDVLTTNLMAPFRLARHFGRRMMRRGRGSILNLVSGSGLQPTPGLGPYGASKAALSMLTRSLAVEVAPTVRVNALCPGLVSEDGQPRNDAHRLLLEAVPMHRVAEPDEIAGAALYLVSPAASYTTGAVLVANGGRPW